MTESLVASQLFGHKRGAFTGAIVDQSGVFETANGGTVFLDEIGDIPPVVQTSLLRVLQEREITRVGESKPRRVNVRVIAATHQDLGRLAREGRFREDLLYRIRIARIIIQPLRHRQEDIPQLVDRFLEETSKRISKAVTAVSEGAMQRLLTYGWPGNVRELQGTLESAAIRCQGTVIQERDLPPELFESDCPALKTEGASENGHSRVLAAIQAAKGNRTAAARLLGISRATLYRRLKEIESRTKSS